MIKINVITNNIRWLRYLKKPSDYIDRKINKINQKNKKFKKRELFCTLLLSDSSEIKKLNKKGYKAYKLDVHNNLHRVALATYDQKEDAILAQLEIKKE